MLWPAEHPYLHEALSTHEAGLELVLFHDGERTCVERRASKNQLSASRPLFLTATLPHFYLINTSGGLVQGDRLNVAVALKHHAGACMMTQSANKIYGMEKNCAVQHNEIRLDSGAYLEFVPEPNIPYGGSRFFQSTTIHLKKNSTLFYWDIIYPGRYARGEEFLYDIYYSGLDMLIEGEPALIDTIRIEPKKHDPRSAGILGKGRFAASVYAYAEDYSPLMKEMGDVSCGVTASGIFFARLVSDSWPSLQNELIKIKSSFRRSYAGRCQH
jgi:urease accessory protein